MQHPAQQPHIAVHRVLALHHREVDPPRLRQHAKLRLEVVKQIAQGKVELLGLELARFEPRDIEQIGDEILGRPQRIIDMAGDAGLLASIGQHLQQGGGKQLGRIEGLGQIVADRRQKTALGLIGPLHLLVHQQQLAVEFGELTGTLGHPRLQMFVRFAQHPLGIAKRRDVGKGHDETTGGHGVALHLDHPPVRALPRRDMGAAALHKGDPPRHVILDITGATEPLLGVVADDLFNRTPCLNKPRRIVEQLDVTAVPGHQPKLPVHHRNPLPDMLDRPLQQAAVEAKHVGGFIDYGGDLLELHVAPLQGRGEHQPCR